MPGRTTSIKVTGKLFTASNTFTKRVKAANSKPEMSEEREKRKKKMVAGKDISNLVLAHRHNSIFNGIVNAFSFKGCLCILSSLITLVYNAPEEMPR